MSYKSSWLGLVAVVIAIPTSAGASQWDDLNARLGLIEGTLASIGDSVANIEAELGALSAVNDSLVAIDDSLVAINDSMTEIEAWLPSLSQRITDVGAAIASDLATVRGTVMRVPVLHTFREQVTIPNASGTAYIALSCAFTNGGMSVVQTVIETGTIEYPTPLAFQLSVHAAVNVGPFGLNAFASVADQVYMTAARMHSFSLNQFGVSQVAVPDGGYFSQGMTFTPESGARDIPLYVTAVVSAPQNAWCTMNVNVYP